MSEQTYLFIYFGLVTYIVMSAAVCIVWSVRELRELLVSGKWAEFERIKMEHDHALYTQQIMPDQTRLIVELEKTLAQTQRDHGHIQDN